MKTSSILLFSVSLPLLLALTAGCKKDSDNPPSTGMALLDETFAAVQQINNIKSLVVVRNDTLIREAYFGSGGADVAHDVRSVTKSITALLVGIAIDQGFISSVDQQIGDFLRPLVDTIPPEKAKITIRDLLTMSSGFEWDELISVSGYNLWAGAANQVQYVLNKPLIAQPGQRFAYNSGALHLLSVILSRATGKTTLDFARQYLFEHLEITTSTWETDNQGYNNGSAGLELTPHDMVKIGQLILHHGEFQGKQVVTSKWIDDLGSFKITTNTAVPYGPGYGYGWWNGPSPQGSYTFAMGWGGQFIITVPTLDLVVVATNTWSGVPSAEANDQWYRTIDLIMTGVLPAVAMW